MQENLENHDFFNLFYLGHNMGFRHDSLDSGFSNSATCSCPDWHGCLMRPGVIGKYFWKN